MQLTRPIQLATVYAPPWDPKQDPTLPVTRLKVAVNANDAALEPVELYATITEVYNKSK